MVKGEDCCRVAAAIRMSVWQFFFFFFFFFFFLVVVVVVVVFIFFSFDVVCILY